VVPMELSNLLASITGSAGRAFTTGPDGGRS
jgi:hypothetical protein